jgi:hypothetical protein
MSSLEFNDNDNAREGKPRFWVFRGRYAVLVVVGAILFMMLFGILSHMGVDFVPTLVLSTVPMALFALWVAFFVNGKPDSYSWDLLLWGRFKLRVWLFRHAILPYPPQFNLRALAPAHPTEYE